MREEILYKIRQKLAGQEKMKYLHLAQEVLLIGLGLAFLLGFLLGLLF